LTIFLIFLNIFLILLIFIFTLFLPNKKAEISLRFFDQRSFAEWSGKMH